MDQWPYGQEVEYLRPMSGGYQIRDQRAMHFVTFQVVSWVDIFTRKSYRDDFLDALRYYRDNQGLRIHAWVVMSNHVHMMLSATQPVNDLSSVIGRLKSFTAQLIYKTLNEEPESRRDWMIALFTKASDAHQRNSRYQIWTHDNHPIELNTNEKVADRLDYIHQNPVRAGIVGLSEDYLYSSARSYAGLTGLLKVDFVDVQLKTVR